MLISASEIIKESLAVYGKNWRKLAVFLVLFFVPTLALSALGTLSLYLEVYFPSSGFASDLIILAVFAASLVFVLWLSIAFARVLKSCLENSEPAGLKTSLATSNHLILPVIYTSLLVTLIVIGGTILLVIPGIIFSVWYGFSFYAVVFEDKKWMGALNASKSLVAGRWWEMLWRLLAPGFLFGLAAGLVSFLLIKGLGMFLMPESLVFVLSSRVVNSLINVLATPLTAAATLILYLSAKQNPAKQVPPPPVQK